MARVGGGDAVEPSSETLTLEPKPCCREAEWRELEAAALLGSAQVEMAGERWGPAEELLGQALKAAEGECWG